MSKNILNSRDLEQELADLLEEFEDWRSNLSDEQIHQLAETLDCAVIDLTREDFLLEWNPSDSERIKAIQDLKNEINSREWFHGITLIRDNYFAEYAEQLAEDIGAIDPNASWPLNHINWEFAAEELKSDYSSVEFDGETYWYRS